MKQFLCLVVLFIQLPGYPLSITQADIPVNGWAVECRVYAEVGDWDFVITSFIFSQFPAPPTFSNFTIVPPGSERCKMREGDLFQEISRRVMETWEGRVSGGYPSKFYTGRLQSKDQPLTLLYTM